MDAAEHAVDAITHHVAEHRPGRAIGLYLYGSATRSGFGPDSDIDLLLVTAESLHAAERRELTELLLRLSGSSVRTGSSRPIELTVLTADALRPWTYPPRRDFRYGEWLREELTAAPSQPATDPDVAILLATALPSHRVLLGPSLEELCDAVPAVHVRAAIRDSLDELRDSLAGDERNVLLTLARMLVTLDDGRIIAKDEAAAQIAARLTPEAADLLERARRGYLGRIEDRWDEAAAAERTAEELLGLVRRELHAGALVRIAAPPGTGKTSVLPHLVGLARGHAVVADIDEALEDGSLLGVRIADPAAAPVWPAYDRLWERITAIVRRAGFDMVLFTQVPDAVPPASQGVLLGWEVDDALRRERLRARRETDAVIADAEEDAHTLRALLPADHIVRTGSHEPPHQAARALWDAARAHLDGVVQ